MSRQGRSASGPIMVAEWSRNGRVKSEKKNRQIMNKKNKLIQDRNNRIREKVWHYMIRMPRMLAYAKAAVEFDLSEDRVREIVARR